MPANYSILSVGQVMRALMKRLPGSSLPNSVTPRNLFPISTRRTWPNLALCQVFLKTLNFQCFLFFKDLTYNFYVQVKFGIISTAGSFLHPALPLPKYFPVFLPDPSPFLYPCPQRPTSSYRASALSPLPALLVFPSPASAGTSPPWRRAPKSRHLT